MFLEVGKPIRYRSLRSS